MKKIVDPGNSILWKKYFMCYALCAKLQRGSKAVIIANVVQKAIEREKNENLYLNVMVINHCFLLKRRKHLL